MFARNPYDIIPEDVIYIGSAGWNIPRIHKGRFPAEGSQLARYSARLNAAEINTSFYRPRAAGLHEPGGWRGLVYYRWHGSPRPYFSPYGSDRLGPLASALSSVRVPAWAIFDNTGSGSAAGNALDLRALLDDNE